MSIPIVPKQLPKPDDRRSMTGYGQTRLSSTVYRPKRQHTATSKRRHLNPSPIVSKTTTVIQSLDPRQATATKSTKSINSP